MAANDYYHKNVPAPPSYDQAAPGHSSPPVPAPAFGYSSHSPVSQDDPSTPYHSRQSQQSFTSEHGAYPAAGRMTDGDQYAENIPLKAHTQYGNHPDWTHQTQYPPYPPSPGALEDRGHRGDGRKKKGFFKKKPAWVTYALTIAQIIVFIVELVKAGQYHGFFVPAVIQADRSVIFNSPINRLADSDKALVQPYDRSLILCADLDGCSVSAMHEEHPVDSKCHPPDVLFLPQ